ncbi:unnamed protein product [Arabis nemorensis]|uniref:WDR11 TPR domain-containing protein n=1 Tax=Arabis nemorensis TaxID=586526 RepID=A0A565BTV6_9BRAS|nr:unnamed protein product [Arabis nemorensis]
MASSFKDLRSYMIQLPPLGDPVVPEMLLKILEMYRKEGCFTFLVACWMMKEQNCMLMLSRKVVLQDLLLHLQFFGETSEALFWLPQAIRHLMNKLMRRSPQKIPSSALASGIDEAAMLSKISSTVISAPEARKIDSMEQCDGSLRLMAFEREELWTRANERLPWHKKLEGEDCIQKQVHDVDTEFRIFICEKHGCVDLVVAANMVRSDNSLSGTHLLCAVGRHQEAWSQLQDSGRWTDAATLAATHLEGSDYARALILYVATDSLQEALTALRGAQPDTVAMFLLACTEIHSEILNELSSQEEESEFSSGEVRVRPDLPGLEPGKEDVAAVCEYFQQYQRKLVHLCMDSQPYID